MQINKKFPTARLENKMVLVRDGTSKLNLAKKTIHCIEFLDRGSGAGYATKDCQLDKCQVSSNQDLYT